MVLASGIYRLCSAPDTRYRYCRLVLIIVLGILAYGNTFSVPFLFDDAANLHTSAAMQSPGIEGVKAAFKSRRAFGIITFQLNHALFGESLFWYHATNLFIHLAAAITLYYLLMLLGETPYGRKTACRAEYLAPLSLVAALLFVAHPLQTQAVTYIVQRFASLATLLYLAAVVSYLHMRLAQEISGRYVTFASVAWGVGLAVCAFLAFYTKETTYTLPLALMVTEFLFFKGSRRKYLLIGAGVLTLTAAIIMLSIVFGRSLDATIAALDETTRIQTSVSRSDYLLTQFRVIMTYIRLLFWPARQSIDYAYTLSHSLAEWRVALALAGIVLLLFTAVILTGKSRNERPLLRFAAFGMFWFFITLLIESSFLPIIDLIFEHRVYLPSVGAFTAVSAGAFALGGNGVRARQRICQGALLVSFLLCALTWQRNTVWQSEVSLWKDAVSKYPLNSRGWSNLAGAYIKRREAENALKATVRALELDRSYAGAWNNLGIAIDLLGVYNDRFHRTSEMFQDPRSRTEKSINRWQGEVNNNLGLAYEILGNFPKAVENYRNAIGYNPALGLAYYNLGIVSAVMKDYAGYAQQRQILLLLDPVLAERLQLRTGIR